MMTKAIASAYSMPMGMPTFDSSGVNWFIIPMRKPPSIAP